MVKTSLFISILVLLLTGCQTTQQLGQVMDDTSSDFHDGALNYICTKVRIGKWVQVYGSSSEMADAWSSLCSQPPIINTPTKKSD